VPKANALIRQVPFDKDDLEWFATTYPGSSVNWVLNMLFKEFRRVHSATPTDYAAIGARELKKQLEDGGSE